MILKDKKKNYNNKKQEGMNKHYQPRNHIHNSQTFLNKKKN